MGAVVGDGIFLLMGEGAKIAGPAVLLAYGLAGILLLFIMVSMGEMGEWYVLQFFNMYLKEDIRVIDKIMS